MAGLWWECRREAHHVLLLVEPLQEDAGGGGGREALPDLLQGLFLCQAAVLRMPPCLPV